MKSREKRSLDAAKIVKEAQPRRTGGRGLQDGEGFEQPEELRRLEYETAVARPLAHVAEPSGSVGEPSGSGGANTDLRALATWSGRLREMGGAPRNPAPRNHLLMWIVKTSGCHCTNAFSKNIS